MKFNNFVVIFLLFIGMLHSLYAQAGQLDPTFNTSGYLRIGFGGGEDIPISTAIQNDGKIVVLGRSSMGSIPKIVVLRYNPDGTPDNTFNSTGKRILEIGSGTSEGFSVALQPDGKILIAGTIFNKSKDFLLLRLNPDGSSDLNFGGGSIVTMDVLNAEDIAVSVLVQPDNKIVVAGNFQNSPSSHPPGVAVMRYNPDGTLDQTFNGWGRVTTLSGGVSSMAFQNDGKIVLSGYCTDGTTTGSCVFRFLESGPLDPSFDGNGRVLISGAAVGDSVAVQPDGKIVLGGYTSNGGGFTVVRINADGTLDDSFDGDGRVLSGFSPGPYSGTSSLVLLPDGRIFQVGYSETGIAAMRLGRDGSFDASFNGSGTLVTSMLSHRDKAYGAAIQKDGKILIVGTTMMANNRNDFLLARLNEDGSGDITFGVDGSVHTDVGDTWVNGNAMAIQSDGKIVIAGTMTGYGLCLARVNSDGSPDLSLNGTGKVRSQSFDFYNVTGMAIYPDERIVVAGGNGYSSIVGRFHSDGTADNSFGEGGRVDLDFFILNAIALQPDGKVLIGGALPYGRGLMIIRLDLWGNLDPTFGRGGKFISPLGTSDSVTALTLQPDGKVLFAGLAYRGNKYSFLVSRIHSNGTADLTFGDNGNAIFNVSSTWSDYATSIAVNTDGKIAVAGYSRPANSSISDFAVARFNSDGSPDLSFNGTGGNTRYLGAGFSQAMGVAFQPDGKIILAGHHFAFDYNVGAIRFREDGTFDDTGWGTNGLASVNIQGNDRGVVIALDALGRLTVLGKSDSFASDGLPSIIRFTSDQSRVFSAPVSEKNISGEVSLGLFTPTLRDK